MSSDARNQLYTNLRAYHESVFSGASGDSAFDALLKELEVVQDATINMILSFINGKAGFSDSTDVLNKLAAKAKSYLPTTPRQKDDKALFESKLDQLKEMLVLASKATFKLRKSKPPRSSLKNK